MTNNSQKKTSSTERKLLDGKAVGLTSLIVVVDIIVFYFGASNEPGFGKEIPLMWSVGGIGIITFFGTLTLANYLSKDSRLDKGEIRRAMAASLIVVYFALVSLVTSPGSGAQESEFSKQIVEHFTWVIGIVIVFYFGSRVVQEYLQIKKKESEGATTEKKKKPKKTGTEANAGSE